MADKNFRVKTGLQVPGVTSANFLSTDSNGTVAAGTTLPIANGGTGQTSANNALNALLPIQSGSTVNYALESDGTNTSWQKLYNQTIQNNGVTVTPRGILNIVGGNFTDSSGSDTTTLTLGSSISTNIADYTLTTSDVNKIIEFNSSSDLNLTLPTYSAAPFSYGSSFSIVNRGTGKVNLVNQSGTTSLTLFQTSGYANAVSSLFYANNLYLMKSSSAFFKSTDAITWTSIGLSNSISSSFNQLFAYGNGVYVLLGTSGIYSSSDGNTWTLRQSLTAGSALAVKYANNKFIAAASDGRMYSSLDGVSWTDLGVVASLTTQDVYNIEYVSQTSTWFATLAQSPYLIKSTDNGVTWTQLTGNTSTRLLATNGSILVLSTTSVSSTNTVLTTTDGITLTSRNLPAQGYLGPIIYDGTKFVTSSYNSTTLTLSAFVSVDGINWTTQSTISSILSSLLPLTLGASGQYVILGWTTGRGYTFGPATTSYISENNGSYIPAGGRAEIYNYNQNQFFVSGDLGNASSVSSNVTLVSGNRYFVDTTSARTLTLPSIPSVGDEIQIFDASGTAFTNNITLSRNGNKINGVSDNAIIDINGASAILTYTGSTYGWRFE